MHLSIKKSISFNLLGHVIPLIVAAVSIPPTIAILGIERFGILTLAWGIVGYFSIFDFGMGRSITKYVSEKLSNSDFSEVVKYSKTGIVVLLIFSLPFTLLLLLFNKFLAVSVINPSSDLEAEVVMAVFYLGVSIPLTLVSNGIRGATEGLGRFDIVNYIRLPQSVLNYLLPFVIGIFCTEIDVIVLALVVSRGVFLVISGIFLYRCLPGLLNEKFDFKCAKEMFVFGGWLSVSNFIGPLILYADRFFISSILGASVLAYYTTPFEIVTKLWVISSAIIGVLFQKFSYLLVCDFKKSRELYRKGQLLLVFAMAIPALLCLVYGAELIGIWIDSDFSIKSEVALKVLCVGVFFSSIAQLSAAFIQACGRPDWTAKVNIVEVFPYLIFLYYLCNEYGVVGASVAWSFRCFFNAMILVYLSEINISKIENR